MVLANDIHRDTISELSLRDLVILPGTTTVRDAIARMRAGRLGCAVVVDDGGKPRGTFTEAVVVAILAAGGGALDEPIEAHLSPGWTCVKGSQPVAHLVDVMQEHDLRFAIVVDDDGRPVALTGQKGLMEYLAEVYPREVCVQNVGRIRYVSSSREGA